MRHLNVMHVAPPRGVKVRPLLFTAVVGGLWPRPVVLQIKHYIHAACNQPVSPSVVRGGVGGMNGGLSLL